MYDIFNQIKQDTDTFLKEADEFIERQKQFNNQLKTKKTTEKLKNFCVKRKLSLSLHRQIKLAKHFMLHIEI